MTKIALIDHYAEEPAWLARNLEKLDALLAERESEVFRCTCEDDDEHPRGSWESDTNAYNHGRDCPSSDGYHYHVLLAGLARHFREDKAGLDVPTKQEAAERLADTVEAYLEAMNAGVLHAEMGLRQALTAYRNA